MEYVHIHICQREREQIEKLRKKQKLLAKIRKALLRNPCSFSQENEKLSLKPIFRFLLAGRYCSIEESRRGSRAYYSRDYNF